MDNLYLHTIVLGQRKAHGLPESISMGNINTVFVTLMCFAKHIKDKFFLLILTDLLVTHDQMPKLQYPVIFATTDNPNCFTHVRVWGNETIIRHTRTYVQMYTNSGRA